MTFKKYQELALTTAIYDTNEKMFICSALGLITEAEEYIEKKLENYNNNDKIDELGDMAWYLAIFTHTQNIKSLFVIDNDFITYNVYDLPSLGAKFLEKIKKSIRDYDYVVPKKYKKEIFEFLEIYLKILIIETENLGYTKNELYDLNIKKLKKRKEKNTLGGDGDNR